MQSETLVPNHAQLPLAYILLTRRHLKLFSLYVSAHTPKPAWIWPAGNFLLAPAQAQISPPATSCSSPQWGSTHRRFQWLPSASTHSTCKFAFASNYAGREARGLAQEHDAGATANACGKCNLEFQLYLYFYEGPLTLSPHGNTTNQVSCTQISFN